MGRYKKTRTQPDTRVRRSEGGHEIPDWLTIEYLVDLYHDNLEIERLQMEDLLLSQMNDNLEMIISQTEKGILGELPNKSAIYFVTTDHRKREFDHKKFGGLPYVMYVGITTNMRNRWNTHPLRKLIRLGFTLMWKPPNESFASLAHEEAMYISILQPPLNVHGWPNTPEDRDSFLTDVIDS